MGLGITAAVVALVVLCTWAAFWAALASNVGMSRGAPARTGLTWGFLLGPVGLAVVMSKTRGGGRSLDERVTAGRQLAGRYGARARRSVDAWREGAPATAPTPSAPAHVQVPPPTWGPPAAAPAPRPQVAPPEVALPEVALPEVAPPEVAPVDRTERQLPF